ncbi:MAG: pyruvate, water dikinase [Desulfobacteraceae bacterium]|nr:MAG: pyruvate, water dikinase [Desulfobacteraceae bacterium]
MKKFCRIINRIFKDRFRKITAPEGFDAEKLRIDFKERYHHFNMLLNANNKALEVMAGIEQALQGKRPFGMSFVKSSCIQVTVSLLRLIKHLEHLSDGKYNQLYDRFDDISNKIGPLIEQKKGMTDERIVIPLHSIDRTMSDLVGGKMANLGEIHNRTQMKVPGGFAITAHACHLFFSHNDLQPEIDKRFISADLDTMDGLGSLSADIQNLITSAEIPKEIEDEISAAWKVLEEEMGRPLSVALRSSAFGEDAAENSFAGQYRSELNVREEILFPAYKDIIASLYSLTAITYRLNRGLRDEDIAMSVGCIAMVDALSGGVAYSGNPLDNMDHSIIINSAWGLPKAVVDGGVDCDLFIVGRSPQLQITRREIKEKKEQFVCYSEEGLCRFDATGDNKDAPSLTDAQALDLAGLAVKLEQYYGAPQDIEWAIDRKGTIYILQCRPLRQIQAEKVDESGKPDQNARENVIAAGGVMICPGAVSGPVFIINNPADMAKFPDQAVLVARQALPVWASLMNRAAAVVTEQGTFAGHLANVAREFNVPAVFGLKDIATLLKNNAIVTVDAARQCVYSGKVDIPSAAPQTPKNRMEGSPVYNVLSEVSRHIVPLNLLDPYSTKFKPENCRTFHDITRFAHEKSVQEMFNFGKEHNFAERSSKQLYYKVPMQWWVLNLDDGFKDEVKGKYIRLENIASIPMLALWDGLIAIPWDGPPSIDGKGLASVMFQSMTNRSLEPGMKSSYTEKNYFMVSKNFCSFSSRLGYHFAITEALVSERRGENYISFQFKGGAADNNRRVRRVQFIADILTDNGFRVDVREDTLISRVEGFEMDYMLERLKILGYLVIHTRQLDMIMTNPNAVCYYRAKIDKDIQSILPPGSAAVSPKVCEADSMNNA